MTDRKESKEAILGELESIKDLLSEEELADIPVLEDTVISASNPLPLNALQEQENTQNDTISEPEFPLLTSVDDDIPTLDDTVDSTLAITSVEPLEDDFDDIPLLDDMAASSSDASPTSIPEAEADMDFSSLDTDEAIPQADDYLLRGVDDILNEDAGDIEFAIDDDSDTDKATTSQLSENEFDLLSSPEQPPLNDDAQLTGSSSESAEDASIENTDLPASLFEDILQDAKEQGLDTSALDNFETFLEISEALENDHNLEPDGANAESPLPAQETERQEVERLEIEEASEDTSPAPSSESTFAIDNSNGLPEPLLAPNALPGQQSLFEIAAQSSLDATIQINSGPLKSESIDFDVQGNDDSFAPVESELTPGPESDMDEPQGLEGILDETSFQPEGINNEDIAPEEPSTSSPHTATDTEHADIIDDVIASVAEDSFQELNGSADPLADELDHLEESLAEITQDPTLAPRKSDADQPKTEPESPKVAKGENPFLPKHIRDRLHTDRSLIDEIKNDPANTSNTAAKRILEPVLNQATRDTAAEYQGQPIDQQQLNDIISDVLHEQLPAIEEEIRKRLLESLNNNEFR